MAFDDLMDSVGGQHRYQILGTILMAFGELVNSLQCLQPILTAPYHRYTCSSFAEEDTRKSKLAAYLNSTLTASSLQLRNRSDFTFGKCSVYLNHTDTSFTCSAWKFDDTVFNTTINSRYNLTCGREPLAHASTSIYFLGHLIGCSLYGSFSDRYGRLKMILLSAANIVVFSIGAAFASSPFSSTNISWYIVLRLLAGVGVGGLFTVSLTMEAEIVGSKNRVLFFMMTHAGSSLGAILLATMGMFIRDQFWLQIAAVIPMTVYFLYPLLIFESPRWLLSINRCREATAVMRKIARMNGRKLPDNFDALMKTHILENPCVLKNMRPRDENDNDEGLVYERCHSNCQDTLLPLFKSRISALTTVQIWGAWFVANLAYSGSYFNVGEIGGNIFLNLIITSAMELPAHVAALFLSKRLGRRATVCLVFIGGGMCCIINACIIEKPSLQIGVQILSMFGQFWFTTAFDTIIFYSCEIFPTVTRNLAVGIGSTLARIGGMAAPQVTLLFHVWRPAPLLLLGALAGSCGIMVLILLPETRNYTLPETIEEWSVLVHSRRWSYRRSSHKGKQQGQNEGMNSVILEEPDVDDEAIA